jgi:hypothetical protein
VRHRTAVALALSVFLTPGCLVARHEGFESPESTVATFQSAFARDDEFAEYDCFAHEVKAAGLTQQQWSTARGIAFEPLGAMGRFVLRRNDLSDNLVARAVAQPRALLDDLRRRGSAEPARDITLDYELFGHGVRVGAVAETTLVLPDRAGGPARAFVLHRGNATIVGASGTTPATLVVELPLPQAVATALAAEGVASLRIERRWKLLPPEVIEDADRPPLAPREPATPRRHFERLADRAALVPTLGAPSFGVVPARFTLPIRDGRAALAPEVDEITWE